MQLIDCRLTSFPQVHFERQTDESEHRGGIVLNSPFVILGIAGSLRRDSFNRATLRAAQELAPEGSKIETFELDGLPGFNQDDEGQPPAKVVELKQRIRSADAI